MSTYFKDFNVPVSSKHNEYFWRMFYETPDTVRGKRRYYIHTSGIVAVVYQNGKERQLATYLKGNHISPPTLQIKICNKYYSVKRLVAESVFPNYNHRMSVVCRDRNPKNCDYNNLIVTSKKNLGKATGHLSSRRTPVFVNINEQWRPYRSVRAAAKAIHCSYQTILDYLSGKVNNSVCKGLVKRGGAM